MIAEDMYVENYGGWFSNPSICYLASGRSVVAQGTAWSRKYPAGGGLLAVTTLEELAAGAEEISANYERHARPARRLAGEYFNSDKVLTRLLEKIG